MNDPEIHSSTWEWDMAGLSSQWRYSHNYRHHVFTNVLEMDDDLGFGVMRMTRDQPWQPPYLLQPLRNLLLAITFEWGIALHGIHAAQDRAATARRKSAPGQARCRQKIARQMVKDYLLFPALSRRGGAGPWRANVAANLLRNLWAYVVIFCGHFPDGAEKFTAAVLEEETRREWYLRQMLGTANFNAGPLLAFASGNLCYQIEHHLFPDLPSNRYAEIATRVRALCDKYDLPYTTGSLVRPVPADAADHPQAGAAGPLSERHLRRSENRGSARTPPPPGPKMMPTVRRTVLRTAFRRPTHHVRHHPHKRVLAAWLLGHQVV